MDTYQAGAVSISGEPELVVIIPSFRHPVLLTEALDSALTQTATVSYVVIVCSDGCPLAETDLVASTFALSDPRVIYLRKPNGGPSSARNFAIDYALQCFPAIRAVFFLDSDNRLTPTALQKGYDALLETPGVGWVYSNIDSFGINWTANYGAPYSPLLHVVYDNFCDTGSFVSCDMLRAGVRFDEDARSGYEDWDFWLQGLSAGFRGKHTPFGFAYRQRPESRFREMNRLRGAMLEHLRQRHWTISAPGNLLRWEHETNPRYLLTVPDRPDHTAFTDPSVRGMAIASDEFTVDLWASLSTGDELWTPALYVFGHSAVIAELVRLGISHNIFLLMERAARKANFAALTIHRTDAALAIETGAIGNDTNGIRNAVLWITTSRELRELLMDVGDARLESLATDSPSLTVAGIHLQAPFTEGFADFHQAASPRLLGTILTTIRAWRGSAYRASDPARWVWRPRVLPQRDEYYGHLCQYLGTSELMPRLSSQKIEIGFLVPIASYGGSEKVAYALAQTLRRRGTARTHLFVLGAARMKILSEYADAFDTVNFLADTEFPVWGGPVTVFGQDVFMPDAPEINVPQIMGFLTGLNLVINCHSAPSNSVMGALRRMKVKTVSYLHLVDTSSHGRPSGHPYITLGFEHAYDIIATCSRRLADELHALGIPSEKLQPIANAASFRISEKTREAARAARARPRGKRRLRCLYLGRLDRQKGVERLFGCVEQIRNEGLPVDVRIVGSTLVDEREINWPEKFHALEVTLEPPVFSTEQLTALYLWADVLLLSSRWEGAPLVIPECQQVGCVPLCTDVGAVAELIEHDRDGLLVTNAEDAETSAEMAREIRRLIENDGTRQRLAATSIKRGQANQWETNFTPLIKRFDEMFKPPRAHATGVPSSPPS